MESVLTYAIFLLLTAAIGVPYWIKHLKHQREAAKKYDSAVKSGLVAPVTLHPHIDLDLCVGCKSCVDVCPMHVLGIVNGKVALVAGLKCIGIAYCEEVCPVGAIRMDFGEPVAGQELPWTDDDRQTVVPGLYIIGELGGMGLIRVAIEQGAKAVEHAFAAKRERDPQGFDLIIVGAGPAGIGAACKAKELGLRYIIFEQDTFGGTVAHYPKAKLVMTSPVTIPLYGPLKKPELLKEEVVTIFTSIKEKLDLNVFEKHKVDSITKTERGFEVKSGNKMAIGASVMLAMGRRGSPRKLNVPGEAELGKVMYALVDAGTYNNKHILVVGGGDSAVEAAMGLASQAGNVLTLSYRRDSFPRIKEMNDVRIKEFIKSKKINMIFNSEVKEIEPDSVTIVEKGKNPEKIKNDFVFVFAGGELPNAMLKKMGVSFRMGKNTGNEEPRKPKQEAA